MKPIMSEPTRIRLGTDLDAELKRLVPLTDLDKPDLIRRGLKAGLPIVEKRYGMASTQIEPHRKANRK